MSNIHVGATINKNREETIRAFCDAIGNDDAAPAARQIAQSIFEPIEMLAVALYNLQEFPTERNQKPSVLLIATEAHASLYDPQTGIQYTLTVDAGPDLSKFLSPVTFRILNAAATSDSEYPNIFIKGEEALEWWRQIVAHYRSQNRIAKFQYNQAVTAEKKAGDILRQWTMDKNDRESVPSPDPSAIPCIFLRLSKSILDKRSNICIMNCVGQTFRAVGKTARTNQHRRGNNP